VYLANISILGLPSEGASVGRYVRTAVEVLQASGLKHEVHAMGSDVEAERLEDIFKLVQAMDDALLKMGAARVTVSLKIDHRTDKKSSLQGKTQSASRRA
jgi:uncharacterized protein (TIGR00106 family)